MNRQVLFESIEKHLLKDMKPSGYLNALNDPLFDLEYPFTLLSRLKDTPQSPKYHPEGSAWNHTMMVVDEAAQRKGQSSDGRAFMWAALLHDIGKPDTTRNRKGKITSYDHDKLGAKLTPEFLGQFTEDGAFIMKVAALVRWHMQILYVTKSMEFADIQGMKEQANIKDIALLGLCDRLGRVGADNKDEEENIRLFLLKCGER